MLFREIIAVYCEHHTERIDTLCQIQSHVTTDGQLARSLFLSDSCRLLGMGRSL
jgi:hypothetical protein